MSNVPENLFYTVDHEWIKIDGDIATIGITDFAQKALGDIVFVELPDVGESYSVNDTFGVVESIKSVSDLLIPVAGEVLERNDDLEDTPELCNESPFDNAWMLKIKMTNAEDKSSLLDATKYTAHCEASH